MKYSFLLESNSQEFSWTKTVSEIVAINMSHMHTDKNEYQREFS